MNRMQKLGIDPNTVEGLVKIMGMKCGDIDDVYRTDDICKHPRASSDMCMRCKAERLFEEVPTKKVQRGTTYTDFNKAVNDWKIYRDTCFTPTIYSDWLAEEIEVEDEEI